MILNLFFISMILVFIIDLSGFTDSMNTLLKKIVGNPLVHVPKPFSCSLCMTFWTGLIYLLVCGGFSIVNIGIVCGFALMTPVMGRALIFIRDFIDMIIGTIERWLHIY